MALPEHVVSPINGRMLGFRDAGGGDPVVLLHAFPFDSRFWEPTFDRLSERMRLIAPDLPGFGGSEPISASTSPLDRMGDAVAVLLEQLRVPRATVVGVSMGGYVALAMARRYPKVVRSLVLCCTRASPDSEEARAQRERTAQRLFTEGTDVLVENLLQKLPAPGDPGGLLPSLESSLRAAPRVGSAAASRGMATRLDSRDWLRRAPMPIHVQAGEHDAVMSRTEQEEMASTALHGSFELLPGVGHLPPLEQPDAFAAALERHIDSLPRELR